MLHFSTRKLLWQSIAILVAISIVPVLPQSAPAQHVFLQDAELNLQAGFKLQVKGQPFRQPIANNPNQNPLQNPNFPNQNPLQNPNFPNQNPGINPNSPASNKVQVGLFGKFTPQGMLIQKVAPGSPAEQAGIIPGDLVLKMDNVVVRDQKQFQQVVQNSGGTLNLIVRRKNGAIQQLVVNLVTGGNPIPAPYLLGITGKHTLQGMLINKVYPGTPAQKGGLRFGDLVQRINNQIMTNDNIFFQTMAVSSGDAIIQVRRGGQVGQVKVRLQLAHFGTLNTYLPQGFKIDVVIPNSAADRAGLKAGDWVLGIDNKLVNNQAAFEAAIFQSGGSWVIKVRKGFAFNQAQGILKVDLMNNSLGCWCAQAQGGMRIVSLGEGTFADKNGFNHGDIIYRVNFQNTPNLSSLQTALENARGLLVVDYRSSQSGQFARRTINLNQS